MNTIEIHFIFVRLRNGSLFLSIEAKVQAKERKHERLLCDEVERFRRKKLKKKNTQPNKLTVRTDGWCECAYVYLLSYTYRTFKRTNNLICQISILIVHLGTQGQSNEYLLCDKKKYLKYVEQSVSSTNI